RITEQATPTISTRQDNSTLITYTTLFRSIPNMPREDDRLKGMISARCVVYMTYSGVPKSPKASTKQNRTLRQLLAFGLFGTPLRSEEHTLNSSHQIISYAVFCLKKKKTKI